MKRLLTFLLGATCFVTTVAAHDPYEITSVAYLHSNRIELFVEMEFPAGMTLAGQKPASEVAVVSQFTTALPRLRELAGNFFNLTAGNNVVLPLATNVELGVEDHIRFQVDYAPTPYRPLKFVARGLGLDSSENPYGTSLTVLDMVNQKVLGQTTLFAGTPTAEFPPRPDEPRQTEANATAATDATATVIVPSRAMLPPQTAPSNRGNTQPSPLKTNWLVATATVAGLCIVVFTFLRRPG